jgi:hypothetical protein
MMSNNNNSLIHRIYIPKINSSHTHEFRITTFSYYHIIITKIHKLIQNILWKINQHFGLSSTLDLLVWRGKARRGGGGVVRMGRGRGSAAGGLRRVLCVQRSSGGRSVHGAAARARRVRRAWELEVQAGLHKGAVGDLFSNAMNQEQGNIKC